MINLINLVVISTLLISGFVAAQTTVLIRGSVVSPQDNPSFQQNGISHQRFSDNGLQLSQAVLASDIRLSNSWQVSTVVNAYGDGEQRVGISQLFAKYRPLVATSIKPEVKMGAFYPALSAENTDVAWLSRDFLSNSAINSWIGEELRVAGLEGSLRRNGRQHQSPWSWKLIGSVFKGNDTTGTLLSWRGFALHDRQSVHNDRVNFLPIPWVVDENELDAPPWTEPFREIDTHVGVYLGAHLAYQRQSELRYYYYDNRADPNKVDEDRIYAWHTKFHSLTLRHFVSSQLSIYGQALIGDTLMGENVVANDFYSAYLAASFEHKDSRLSARVDWYQVVDNDETNGDPNASQGAALTINYTRSLTEYFTLSAEWQINQGRQANLVYFQDTQDYSERVWQLALTYRY